MLADRLGLRQHVRARHAVLSMTRTLACARAPHYADRRCVHHAHGYGRRALFLSPPLRSRAAALRLHCARVLPQQAESLTSSGVRSAGRSISRWPPSSFSSPRLISMKRVPSCGLRGRCGRYGECNRRRGTRHVEIEDMDSRRECRDRRAATSDAMRNCSRMSFLNDSSVFVRTDWSRSPCSAAALKPCFCSDFANTSIMSPLAVAEDDGVLDVAFANEPARTLRASASRRPGWERPLA